MLGISSNAVAPSAESQARAHLNRILPEAITTIRDIITHGYSAIVQPGLSRSERSQITRDLGSKMRLVAAAKRLHCEQMDTHTQQYTIIRNDADYLEKNGQRLSQYEFTGQR